MSRIAVVTSSPPMVEGGHMVIARSLVQALREAGHDAEVVVTPQNRFGAVGRRSTSPHEAYRRRLERRDPIDQAISQRYPSYAVRHPRHVCWLNHTMREHHDLWPRFWAGLSPQGRVKEGVRRRLIHVADRYLLTRNVKRLFVLVAHRAEAALNVAGTQVDRIVSHLRRSATYRCDACTGDYIFMVSRLTPLKRADLLVRALAVAGRRGVSARSLPATARNAPVSASSRTRSASGVRATFTGALTDALMVEHLARCRAVCFPPLDEDYGFVTAEAFASAKGVVTCRDSGGPVELIEDGVTGLVCDPSPDALATALARVMTDRSLAETMGAAALQAAARLKWADAVAALTAVD